MIGKCFILHGKGWYGLASHNKFNERLCCLPVFQRYSPPIVCVFPVHVHYLQEVISHLFHLCSEIVETVRAQIKGTG